MKKIIFFSFLLALAALLVPVPSQAAGREVIESITSSIEINDDASVMVTEKYDFIALGIEIKRGLLLEVPTVYRTANGGTRRARLDIISITLDGKNTKISEESTSNGTRLRVGDPDRELQRGNHQIVLQYKLDKMVGFFGSHDELYWSAVGTNIGFPVLSASARVKLPGRNWGDGFKTIEFYTGKYGEKGNAARVQRDNSVETTQILQPREGLTVVYTWEKGIIAPPVMGFLEKLDGLQYILIAILMGIYYLAVWFKVGRDLPLGTIIPLFYPPKVDPGSVRYVVEQGEDSACFTSNLIDLAVAGYVNLSKDEIAATQKKADPSLPDAQKRILDHLGDKNTKFDEYSETLEGAKGAAELSMRGFGESLFTLNTPYWLGGILFLLLFPIFDFSLSFTAPIGALLSGGLIIASLHKKRGFWKWLLFALAILGALIISLTAALIGYDDFGGNVAQNAFFSILACSAMIALFWRLMPNYSAAGRKLLADAAGLKLYMGTAEKSRLEMFNPPEETPEVFERLLPWALSLGVAKTWANRFEKILERANYRPNWYDGDPHYLFYGGGLNRFNSGVSSASMQPKSDFAGSSGSGGGGFSGGGGGGTSVSGW